jgi:hypothetical protein
VLAKEPIYREDAVPPAKKTTRKAAATTKKTAASTRKTAGKTTARRRGVKALSSRHKAAMARGRTEAAHVRAYVEALHANKPKRGRQRTEATIQKQLTQVRADLRSASGMKKLELVARRMELEAELDGRRAHADLSGLRQNFVKHAGSYARRKGIPKAAFREAGVPAADIRAAGIP